MEYEEHFVHFSRALADFHKMRRRADLSLLLARLQGKSVDLLAYGEVKRQLGARGGVDRGLQDIPLDAIVGSVNRSTDFTRSFLPRRDSDAERWANVDMAVTRMEGLEPIEVYQIGDGYFVIDGNHRVSVARYLGAETILAHVVEVQSLIPLKPDDSPDDLILKERLTQFLESTGLAKIAVVDDFQMSSPGRYRILLDDITSILRRLERESNRSVTLPDAAENWYWNRYQPVCEEIRLSGMLYHFPKRTVADLFAWIIEHQQELTDELQWSIDVEQAAEDLDKHYNRPREERSSANWLQRLLVPVSDSEASQAAVRQSIEIARLSGAQLYGLHVLTSQRDGADSAARAKEMVDSLCSGAGLTYEFAVVSGSIAGTISDRARWVDLVVTGVTNPPEDQLASRLSSGFGALVRRSSRPVLAVPGTTSSLRHALLAFDGSTKAWEALSLSAYLAGSWQMTLTVLTVASGPQQGTDLLDQAEAYLNGHGVRARFVSSSGHAGDEIIATADACNADCLVMGGYSRGRLAEVAFGSTVDQVVRSQRFPVLICP